MNPEGIMARAGVRRPKTVARWTFVAALALLARGALAASPEEITLDRMRLSTDRSGILSVESGEVLPHLGLAGAAWLGYANDQLVLHRLSDGLRVGSLVNDRWSGAVSAEIGILDRGQLGLEVPVVFHQASSGASAPGAPSSLDAFGVGSLRLVPKVRLLDTARHGLDLAVQAGVTVPLGADGFVGSELGVQPELAASRTFGDLRLAGNLGASFRDEARLLDERLGNELNGQLGAAYGLKTLTHLPLELGAVLAAAASASHPFDRSDETSVELRGFGAYDVVPAVRVLAGAGFGLETGWGTPDWRVFGGVQFAMPRKAAPAPVAAAPAPAPAPAPKPKPAPPPPPPDSDGDGILDADDRCPKVAGPRANHGCPDEDRDGDGVVDRLDQCPDLAGPKDNRGCPVKGAAKLEGDRITLDETVYFDTSRDTIQARSKPLLDNVATIMKAHPEIGRVRVEGHTDSRGSRAYNLRLSKRRAAAVVKALVQRGVAGDRLESAGFGPDRPVADNGTDAGRAKNRRVVLQVTSSGTK
jgi:outer membrane protein OmpA-like peptidoglycan-associated protein